MRNKVLLTLALAIGAGAWIYSSLDKQEARESSQITYKTGYEKWQKEYEKKRLKHSQVGYKKSDKPSEYTKLLNSLKTREGAAGPEYSGNYRHDELTKAKVHKSKAFAAGRVKAETYDFTERGPGNVPGRTRALVVDPTDSDVWIAGAVGGGIWKTLDGGQTWTNKSADLPNLAISCIVMSASDNDILYAGTGEGWGASGGMIKGSGIFKSIDKGDTWTQLPSTADNDDFQMVNRLVVSPTDPDLLLAANSHDPLFATEFNSGIWKSIDGGTTWTNKIETDNRAQQIVADPNDFSILYATVYGTGVIKSTDTGETWTDISSGLIPNGRIEMAVSPVDTDRLYASVQGDVSGTGSDLYVSSDAGATWNVLTDKDADDVDFLGGQGWYDNTILAHPFDKDIVYVAGVNMFQFTMQDGEETGDPQFLSASENGTETFFDLTNFDSGDVFGSKIALGDIDASEFVSIEIRFGSGRSQKAHRFTVPDGAGAGVADADYAYQNYVDVPFEVWDTDNNVQLMVAFRDQQQDGKFNLIESNTEGEDGSTHSREYLFVSTETYNATTASSNMAVDGGHVFNNMYFFWPFLAEGGTWDEDNLPTSEFVVEFGTLTKKYLSTVNITDAYGQFGGNNQFSQTTGATTTEGVHPDNHNIVPVITDEVASEFQLILTNDGGVYKSNSGTNPGTQNGDWTFSGTGYNTTQFYAIDKMPGESRYIGGTQDNGTWLTQANQEGSASAAYARANGGDGFGVAWHHQNPDLLLSCVYNNSIERSTDGGATFSNATSGLTNTGEDDSPFNTKIENVDSDPDIVFAVGASGVFKSTDFAENWALTAIPENWVLRSFIDVKISKANNNIVWAGGAMAEGENLHVSTDGGESFSATTNFSDVTLGQISGLATHPTEDSTAYALFSFAKAPKILKTDDLGKTWTDISGFGTGSTSTSGFPDVAVYDLLVMPHETSTLWAGTEIGIFESTDSGATWSFLSGDMPAASIWELKHVDDQIIVGTHGRGIFSTTIAELPEQGYNPEISLVSSSIDEGAIVNITLPSASSSLELYIEGELVHSDQDSRSAGDYEFVTTTTLAKNSEIYARSYFDGLPYVSRISTGSPVEYNDAVESYVNDFESSSSDFYGFGFEISSDAGLGGKSINIPGGYKAGANYTYLLKTPIIVSADAETNKIEFSEIVVVEPDNDYVVVEGSKDGATWLPLVDSYDASADADWETLFNDGANPVAANAKERSIVLTNTFDAGDEILIRFRLSSNGSINGWGWSIDNLKIQSVVLSSPKTLELSSMVYPNPINKGSMMNIQLEEPNAGKINVAMRNISGQLVYSSAFDLISGQSQIQFQVPDHLKSGAYFVRLWNNTVNSGETHKILINNNH